MPLPLLLSSVAGLVCSFQFFQPQAAADPIFGQLLSQNPSKAAILVCLEALFNDGGANKLYSIWA